MKTENEITVAVQMTRAELMHQLKEMGFVFTNEYHMEDVYFTEPGTEKEQDPLALLNRCVLLRSLYEEGKKPLYSLVRKHKVYGERETILNQTQVKVKLADPEEGRAFLELCGFRELLRITDDMTVFEKNDLGFCIQWVNNKYLLLEIEENEQYSTVKKLIAMLDAAGVRYDHSNYFVNKAKLVLRDRQQ